MSTFKQIDFSQFKLPIITIYERPKDFPEQYVARIWDLQQPTHFYVVENTIEKIREAIPASFTRMPRDANDDPVIKEVWI